MHGACECIACILHLIVTCSTCPYVHACMLGVLDNVHVHVHFAFVQVLVTCSTCVCIHVCMHACMLEDLTLYMYLSFLCF